MSHQTAIVTRVPVPMAGNLGNTAILSPAIIREIATLLAQHNAQDVVMAVNTHIWATVPSLNLSVWNVEMTGYAKNRLLNANIVTLADICQKTESDLLRIGGLGKKTLLQIKRILQSFGLALRADNQNHH